MLKVDYEKVKTILTEERKHRAESEARATIAETAKTATGQKMALTESEMLDLQRKISFYENLLSPQSDQERLQCFNMKADYAKGKVRYGVSFLKNNPKDRTKLEVKVELRVLQGTQAASDETTLSQDIKPLSTRSFALTKDYRLSGTLTTTVTPEQLHILDIRVFDAQNNTVAKCWQSI